ncbi:SCO family protein [Deinococcus sp. YIM 77859]|uniref:SCO family protein n=1 Tax=Deinococcus sp. YIM 77859 TaxID=1540221 RepID=UPI00054FB4C3|nr:SCO family protein [Deinococcus sp. YIM 77859]
MKWLTAALLTLAAVLGGLLLFRSFAPLPTGGTALDAPVTLPALRLVDDRGQATTLNDSGGKLRLVFYGFVRCPDVCPATLAALKNIYAGLRPEQRERVQVQLITVDPDYDRPKVLRDYLNRFDPAFTGLTGNAATIDEAARVMFVTNVKPQPAPQSHTGHTEQHGHEAQTTELRAGANVAARIHGDQVSVVDPQGRFVRVYNNAEVIGGALEHDLPALLRLYSR